jgi:thiol-disulfide isomerase/thioredoxin
MKLNLQKLTLCFALLSVMLVPAILMGQASEEDQKRIAEVMKLRPKQPDVDYDIPAANEIKNCRIERAAKTYGVPGWIVYDNTGRVIRVLLDKDKDRDLDQWSYYKNGIEVYREVDEDLDGNRDQYRWMGSAGRRWGVGNNQNNNIESWKSISAEEVAEEAFYAFKNNDRSRFLRLLLKQDELKQLDLGDKMNRAVTSSVNDAAKSFSSIVAAQKEISKDTKFVDFGGSRPALVPAGREGINLDLVVYDHAQSLFGTGNTYGQISLGTIVEVGDTWRILEAPQMMTRTAPVTNGGLFFPMPTAGDIATGGGGGTSVDPRMSAMFDKYEKLEKQLRNAKQGVATQRLQQSRADLLVEMIAAHEKDEDVMNWTRQMADTVSNAYQRELFPEGLAFLERYLKSGKRDRTTKGLDYVEFRVIQARSHKGMQGDSRDRAAANERYMEDLEDYVKNYPKGEFSADALMQLALYSEVSDERDAEDIAAAWYQRVVDNFEGSPQAVKATGAVRRLGAIGRSIPFSAPTLVGDKTFDLRAYRGKRIVVLHYWATWLETTVEDFDELKRLKAKYKDQLSIIGCNLDDDGEKVKAFLKGKGVTWPQLWDEGGLEGSSLATQLGVTTLPLTILVDKSGEVIENQISVNDLDRDIQRSIRRAKANGGAAANANNRAGANPDR